jgi:hypothetical protein
MPIKINPETRQFIESVPLPVYEGDSYTVISHGSIIDNIKKNLERNNLEVIRESYSPAQNGNIVTGTIQVGRQDDELSFNISFLNSYNKAKRFVVAGGSQVIVCQNGHILGISELGGYKRTHTGSADLDAEKYIQIICDNAETEFRLLTEQKDKMKNIDISMKDIQHLVSELYFQEDLIKDTQMSILKKELDNPSFNYGTPQNNLWTAYNHITCALKTSHPKDYIETHQKVNRYLSEQFNLFNNRDIQSIVEVQYEIEPVFSLGESILV